MTYERYTFTTAHGTVMQAVLIPAGQPSAARPMRPSDTKVTVEFYDTRYSFTPYGQFAGDYYASTLLKKWTRAAGPLMIDTGVPAWDIDSRTMADVIDFIIDRL